MLGEERKWNHKMLTQNHRRHKKKEKDVNREKWWGRRQGIWESIFSMQSKASLKRNEKKEVKERTRTTDRKQLQNDIY